MKKRRITINLQIQLLYKGNLQFSLSENHQAMIRQIAKNSDCQIKKNNWDPKVRAVLEIKI
jgi:hypothetical protein